MVTSEYPKGLYGDGPPADSATGPGLAAEAPPQQAPTAESSWQLTPSSAAKSLITVALVVGAVAAAGYVALAVAVGVITATSATNTVALTQVEAANGILTKSIQSFPSAVSACGGQLTCVTALDRQLAGSLNTFAGTIKSISVSGSASAAAAASVVSDTNATAQDLNQLGSATSVAQYQQYASSGELQQALDSVSADYATLIKDLQGT
jgi:hypothetical protein